MVLAAPGIGLGHDSFTGIMALTLAVRALGFLVWRTRRPATSQTGSAELP